MDDRQLRAELETLQHEAKSLRSELTLEHAPGFVEKRDELQRLIESTEVLLKKESDERNTALRQDRELRASIAAARSSLASVEQRRLSPVLILVPFAAFFFLPGHDLLRNKPLMWIAAVVSAAVLGFIAGSKLEPRNTDDDQGPLLPTLGAPVVTHLVGNGTMWGLFSLLVTAILLLLSGEFHANALLWTSTVQAGALVALGFAASSTTSTFVGHRWAGWLEVGVSWLIIAAMPLYAVLTQRQEGSGLAWLAGLVALAAPVLTAAVRIAHTKWPLRHRGFWVAPMVASLVLTAAAVVGGARPGDEAALVAEVSRAADAYRRANEEIAFAKRLPPRELPEENPELKVSRTATALAEARGAIESMRAGQTLAEAALALAGQLALAALLFAFTLERWKGRLIAAAPLLLFVGVVFALKR